MVVLVTNFSSSLLSSQGLFYHFFCVLIVANLWLKSVIETFSMGKFNKGGSCKLQLPQVKFKTFELLPFSHIKEGAEL